MSFPNRTERYKTEGENRSALSICPFVGDLLGAQGEYQVLDKEVMLTFIPNTEF